MTIKRVPVEFARGAAAVAGAGETARTKRELHRRLNDEDGTRQLLASGCWTLAVAGLACLLLLTVMGGIGPQGAHTNGGWLALIVAMMCAPFAVLLLLLGGAKWLRNDRLSRRGESGQTRG